jgi:hypothetical protein
MELIIRLLGMCITFIPIIYFANYIINKASSEQRFEIHINNVKDKHGSLGVLTAYINRFSLFTLITSLGVLISSYFDNRVALDIVAISLVIFIFSYCLDDKNTKYL